jgi:hypothetical protein
MIIQSSGQPMQRRNPSAQFEETDEVDEDPWSGYVDTLEIEIASDETEAATAQVSPESFFSNGAADDDFAAAQARLDQRGQLLQQQQMLNLQRSASQQQHFFPHLNGQPGTNYGSSYYQPPAGGVPRQTAPLTHTAIAQAAAPASLTQADPFQQPEPGLPYEIDAWGNPILPENAELDAFGNLFYRYV